MEGKLKWYCLDYWSNVLQLDIAGLKAEISGLITGTTHCHRISGKTSAIFTEGSAGYQCTS